MQLVRRLPPALLGLMAAFQAALAAGAPLGSAAWGGRHPGTLPEELRITSGVASVVYAGAAVALASPQVPRRARQALAWICVAVGAAGTVANAASPSVAEKPWALWSAALAITSWPIARGRHRAGGVSE